jgi:hypothetical protein
MATVVTLTADAVNHLDLTPVTAVVEPWLQEGASIAQKDQQLTFEIDYPRDLADPRELSEIPELRLWFVRLDTRYPWLPYLIDWRQELPRYAAMLVPHQFSPTEGIQYNPEALEIFVMSKIFTLADWLKQQDVVNLTKVKFMTKALGYELDDGLFGLLR